jgi:hypothetical protein
VLLLVEMDLEKKLNQLHYPTGISFDRQGNLYIVSQSIQRVQKFLVDNNEMIFCE